MCWQAHSENSVPRKNVAFARKIQHLKVSRAKQNNEVILGEGANKITTGKKKRSQCASIRYRTVPQTKQIFAHNHKFLLAVKTTSQKRAKSQERKKRGTFEKTKASFTSATEVSKFRQDWSKGHRLTEKRAFLKKTKFRKNTQLPKRQKKQNFWASVVSKFTIQVVQSVTRSKQRTGRRNAS